MTGVRFARIDDGAEAFGGFFAAETAARFIFLTCCTALPLAFVTFVFVALWARALPAGKLFVAGFKRVNLVFEDVLTERAADDRGESFFTLLVIGVLMREGPQDDG